MPRPYRIACIAILLLTLSACGRTSSPSPQAARPSFTGLGRLLPGRLSILRLDDGPSVDAVVLSRQSRRYHLEVFRWTAHGWQSLPLAPAVRAAIPDYPSGPGQEVSVSFGGAGHLSGRRGTVFVLLVHTAGADCGDTAAYLLAVQHGRLEELLATGDACSLEASMRGGSLVLRGPVYGPDTPLCCPQRIGQALVRYQRGRWIERPRLFPLFPPGA